MGRGFVKAFSASQPIYAMQAPELTSSQSLEFCSIKERAQHHFLILRRYFPRTGVHLFGSSFGGPLVADIALLFQQASVPFTITMHDPLPAMAPVHGTNDVQRRAKDFFNLAALIDTVDLAKHVDFNPLTDLVDQRCKLKLLTSTTSSTSSTSLMLKWRQACIS